MCERGLRLLSKDNSLVFRLIWRSHARLCRACGEVRSAEQWLNRYAAKAGQWEAPTPPLPALPSALHTRHAVRKEVGSMRRLAYVALGVVVMVIGAVIIIPGRGRKLDARAILADVAHAMEQVTSMHTIGRDTSAGKPLPGVVEDWYSARAEAHRYYDKGSGVLLASRADLDSRQWWFYDSTSHTLYKADLTPVMEQATKAVPRLFAFYTSESIKDRLEGRKWPDAQVWARMEVCDGRKVMVVTCDRRLDIEDIQPPIHVTDRYVYEVDPSTHRLLAHRRYWQYKDGTEKLIHEVSSIEYDVPVPSQQLLLAPAQEVHEVQATVVAVKEYGDNCLVLEYQGERLNPGTILTTLKFPNN